MRNHIKTLGALYIVFGLLGVVVGVVFLQTITGHASISNKLRLIFSTSGFGSVLAFFFTVVSVPSLVAGMALFLRTSWARTLVLVLGFVNIFNIPLGTMLGIYTIWVLVNAEPVKRLDAEPESEPMPRVFPPYH